MRTARVAPAVEARHETPRVEVRVELGGVERARRIAARVRRTPSRRREVEQADEEQDDPETRGPMSPVAGAASSRRPATAPRRPRTPRTTRRPRAKTTSSARGEPEADAQGPLALAHELARRVVDRRDVVSVERVAQAEGVGRDPQAQAKHPARVQGVMVWHHGEEQDREADDVQPAIAAARKPARRHSAGVSATLIRGRRAPARVGVGTAAIARLPRSRPARSWLGRRPADRRPGLRAWCKWFSVELAR